MNAYTTLKITRSKAEEVARNLIPKMTNLQLEEVMDSILERKLYYALIVSNEAKNDNKKLEGI